MKRRLPSGTPGRPGFTLVELLVVISIIGMLAALLLPAVNAAREAGRKSVCVNNQRQIGLAIFQYETAKNQYPGYVNPQALVDVNNVKIATRPVGWVFSILPQLERSDLADNFGANAPKAPGDAPVPDSYPAGYGPYAVPNFFLKILVCPSDASSENPDPEGLADQARLSYVVNTGLKDEETNPGTGDPPDMQPLPMASQGYPRDWAANGVFHYNFPYALVSGEYVATGEKITKTTSSSITDGTSTTLLLSENADAGAWTNVLEQHVGFYWQATVVGSTPAPAADGAAEFLSPALLRINDQAGLSDSAADLATAAAYGRPSSYHPGGVVVTYADAHTSFLSQDVDYLVYCLIMSPRGKYTLPAGINGISTAGQALFLNLPQSDARSRYARDTLSEDSL